MRSFTLCITFILYFISFSDFALGEQQVKTGYFKLVNNTDTPVQIEFSYKHETRLPWHKHLCHMSLQPAQELEVDTFMRKSKDITVEDNTRKVQSKHIVNISELLNMGDTEVEAKEIKVSPFSVHVINNTDESVEISYTYTKKLKKKEEIITLSPNKSIRLDTTHQSKKHFTINELSPKKVKSNDVWYINDLLSEQ